MMFLVSIPSSYERTSRSGELWVIQDHRNESGSITQGLWDQDATAHDEKSVPHGLKGHVVLHSEVMHTVDGHGAVVRVVDGISAHV